MLSKNKSKKKLGFSTSPSEMYVFLQKFSKFLEKSVENDSTGDISENKTYIRIIQDKINQPIGPKPLELLRFMRENSEFSYLLGID